MIKPGKKHKYKKPGFIKFKLLKFIFKISAELFSYSFKTSKDIFHKSSSGCYIVYMAQYLLRQLR